MAKKIPYYKTEAGKASHRKSNLKRLYQITPEDYAALMLVQDFKCAICQRDRDQFQKDFVVDHNHGTGKVRALLCPACNTAIGLLGDNPEIMERAAAFVRGAANAKK